MLWIGFKKLFYNVDEKCFKNPIINLFLDRNLWKEINSRINSFFTIIILNFLFLTNLFADFLKFFKHPLFNTNTSTNSENVYEQWNITEKDNEN